MNQNFKIRKAIITDADLVFNFISHLEERTFDFESFKEKFKENIEKPEILYLVAVGEKDEAVGFISSHGQNPLRLEGKLFEIQEIYVSKSCRGKGIEQLLFTGVEERISKLDCERMEVSADINRIEAKKFYIKLGFSGMLARYVKAY
ncbi:MAG TPA: GNAT family N-acetyltransferase [Puia sp.]|jgi:ribosomal protein S18 acetylase RimI-like enzyme|nr:GNAT family N-acetyltransferase [Puia sp.]